MARPEHRRAAGKVKRNVSNVAGTQDFDESSNWGKRQIPNSKSQRFGPNNRGRSSSLKFQVFKYQEFAC